MNYERYCISSRRGTASWQRVVRASQRSAQSPAIGKLDLDSVSRGRLSSDCSHPAPTSAARRRNARLTSGGPCRSYSAVLAPPLEDTAAKPLNPATCAKWLRFSLHQCASNHTNRTAQHLTFGRGGCYRARRPLGIFPMRDRRQRLRLVRSLIGCTQTGLRVATRFRKRLRMPGRVR